MAETPIKLTNESGEWEYVPYTDEEVAEANAQAEAHDSDLTGVRQERNSRLSACDWVDLPNAPFTAPKKTEWATYRQELRDYPAQSDRVSTLPDWPTEPE